MAQRTINVQAQAEAGFEAWAQARGQAPRAWGRAAASAAQVGPQPQALPSESKGESDRGALREPAAPKALGAWKSRSVHIFGAASGSREGSRVSASSSTAIADSGCPQASPKGSLELAGGSSSAPAEQLDGAVKFSGSARRLERGGSARHVEQKFAQTVLRHEKGAMLWDRGGIHADDVHALIRTTVEGQEGLVTGGKDGRISFSTLDGSDTRELIGAPRGRGQHWVTSMAVDSQGLLAFGRRSGLASVWDLKETICCLAECAFTAVSNDYAKERNQDRIHSMSWVSALEGEEGPQTLSVGLNGRMVRVSKLLEGWTEIECDPRAWVYGCLELDPQRFVVIEGAGLATLSEDDHQWRRTNLMLARMHGEGRDGPGREQWEDRRFVSGQKLISHLKGVPGHPQQFVLSQFDGSVTRMDIGQSEQRRFQCVSDVSSWILNDYGSNSAYSRRVWQTIPLGDAVWIAATDDGTLPLLDWRMRGVAQRFSRGGERVSCVEAAEDGFGFYAVSCATRPAESGGAHLRAYDMRMAL